MSFDILVTTFQNLSIICHNIKFLLKKLQNMRITSYRNYTSRNIGSTYYKKI